MVREPSHPYISQDAPGVLATAEWVPLERLDEINFLPYVPGLVRQYAETGAFTPVFLSGHFEKA